MSTATRLTHEQQHDYLNRALPILEGNVAWLVEYFTPDDDDSDRFTRIEDRLGHLESRVENVEQSLIYLVILMHDGFSAELKKQAWGWFIDRIAQVNPGFADFSPPGDL